MLFGIGSKKKGSISEEVQPTNNASVTNNSAAKVILDKAKLGLNENIVRLKRNGINLEKHRARVFVVMDRSGSMGYSPKGDLYKNGYVQEVLTRLLPLALKFDDDGELEVYVFNNECVQLPSMTMNNYESYVENVILSNNYGPSGGTNYAPVIRKAIRNYKDDSEFPAFGMFITDGSPSDEDETNEMVRKSSKYKMFLQFVGIGEEEFGYLERLDNLEGRKVDNTAFIKVSDFSKLNDEQLYEKLLEQYPQWLKSMNIN